MSLINDALKKAQRQRTGDTPPSPLSAPPMPGGNAAPPRAQPKKDPSPALLLTGAGVAIGLVLGGAALWFFRSSGERAPTKTTPPATVATAPKPREAAASTAAAAVETPAKPAEPMVALTIPTAKPEPAVAVSANTPAGNMAGDTAVSVAAPGVTPVVQAPAPTPVASAPVTANTSSDKISTPGEPSEQMINAIESYRVMGIRATGGVDAKVLMNDRVFRVGDMVDRALGIRLIGATANSLTFKDASGATYTRNF